MEMDKITYKRTMLEISKRLTETDMKSLKYIFTDEIGDAVLERANTPIEFIRILEMNNFLGPTNLNQFARVLDDLGKNDLVALLTGKKPDPKPIQESRLNNDFNTSNASNNGFELNAKHFDKIAYYVGTDWNRFGRYLSLTDAEIDMIDNDYRKTLEKANQILVKWRQKNGNVTWQQLKKNLELIERFDIIRQIEKDFPDIVTRPGIIDRPGNIGEKTQPVKHPIQEVGNASKLDERNIAFSKTT